MQQIIAITTVVCLAAGLAGAVVLARLRGRSTAVLVVVASLVPLAAVSLAVVVNVRRMFISAHDSTVVLVALGCAGLIGVLLSLVLGRQVAAEATALTRSLRTLGHRGAGSGPEPGVPDEGEQRSTAVSSELSALGRELETTRLRLAASERRERALESSRRELVAFMSHDLRTPLAGLRALAEGLEDGVIEPEPALRQMRQTVGRLDGLVGDLFELSRVSSPDSRPREDATLVSLVEVAHDVVCELQQHAQQRRGDLHLQVTGDDDRLAVTGNGEELTRLLGNLVGNAVRHTSPGGSVVVRAERCADGRTQVSVLDECGGIAEPDLPRVFEAGWRADPERSGRDAGAGLGLAIAQGIVESHAGSISVANVDGGCRFDVALPAAPAAQPTTDLREEAPSVG
jgi:signal transduction histidine kinase